MHIVVFILAMCLVSCAGVQSRYHQVESGENLQKIAQRYEVPVTALKGKNEKVLSRGLKPGTKLYIPFESNPNWNEEFTIDETKALASETPDDGSANAVASAHFSWPVRGNVSSHFGPRKGGMHEGIDIAANRGTPIFASRSGHVIYSGNRIKGYGNLVIVKHADSFSTVYAHLSRIQVKKGQFVARGQVVGRVGRTGRATGNHLHFEIRNSRVAVNPMHFLQPRVASNSVGR